MTTPGLSIKVIQLRISDLLQYHHPEEIIGYCRRCPNYGLFWSCPPHGFDTKEYLKKFNYCTVIGVKIQLDSLDSEVNILDYYHLQRKELNERLLKEEKHLVASTVLVAGHCWHCKTCVRNSQKACLQPDKNRYSLESLGIKISDIIRDEFNDALQWQKDKEPKSLYIVQAILSEADINNSDIKWDNWKVS